MRNLHLKSIILALSLLSNILQAKEVNKQTAEKVAINAFAALDNNQNTNGFKVKEIVTVKSEEKATYYIVNFSPTGFIIVSSSDVTFPILGSSIESNLSLENLPPQLNYLFESYKAQIKEAEKLKIGPSDEIKQKWDRYTGSETSSVSNSLKSATTLPSSVNPLIQTTWGQNIGYNRFCPADNAGPGGHVLAGCVATAMAQILKYWGCKVNGSGTTSYYHLNYGTLSVDFNAADYNWSAMGNSPSDDFNAKLIRDCGVSVSMNYGPDASPASPSYARAVFSTFFGYKTTSNYVYKSSYTDSAWKDLLKQDLSLGRPILYSGESVSPQTTGAHTWVIDGYDSSDKFHCNWGGSGYGDAFYLLTNLTSDNGIHLFTSSNQAVIGLEPVMPNCENINGVPVVCSSGTAYNVPNLPGGSTVTWKASSNISPTTGTSQASNPFTFQANGSSGSGWIEATVNYNGNATIEPMTVWVGPYSSGNYPITGPSSAPCRQYVYYSIPNLAGVTSINWIWPSSWSYVSGQGTPYLALQTGLPGSGGIVGAQAVACSPGSYATMYTSVFGTCGYSMLVSPNPASNDVTIELLNENPENQASSLEWELEVFDQVQVQKTKTQKIKDKKYKLNIQDWKDGIYIIRAKIGDEFISEKLIVKH